jgi:transposase-like protein
MAGNSNSGRPSTYSEETAARICSIIEQGKTMAQACRELDLSRSTVHRWEKEHDTFKAAVHQARVDGAWCIADEILTISDDLITNNADASRQRERLRVRMWLLSKVQPMIFGERVELNVTTKVDLDAAMAAASARLARRGRAALDVSDAEIVPPLKLAVNDELLS